MGNAGHSASACAACRRKHVKCDEAKPQCDRCYRSGRICPGYKAKADLIFWDQNEYAKDKALGRRASAKAMSSSPPSSPSSFSALIFVPGPQAMIISEAMSHFSHDFVLGDDFALGIPDGSMNHIPDMWRSNKLPRSLQEALPAVAMANMCCRSRQAPQLLEVAYQKYGRALSLVIQAIREDDEVRKDHVLMTIIVLSLFELIIDDKSSRNGTVQAVTDAHYVGRRALLKLRGTSQLGSATGRALFRMAFTQVCVADLLKRRRPPPDAAKWLSKMNTDYAPDRLLHLVLALTQFCAEADELMRSKSPDKEKALQEKMVEGEGLHDRLEDWAHGESERWQFQRVRTAGPRRRAEDSGCTHVYHDLTAATNWNHSRALRIFLVQCLVQLAKALQALNPVFRLLTGVREALWQSTTAMLVDDICDCLSYVFSRDGSGSSSSSEDAQQQQNAGGDDATATQQQQQQQQQQKRRAAGAAAAGYLSLWPLRAAMSVAVCSDEQKARLLGWLRFIGHELGIGQAAAILAHTAGATAAPHAHRQVQ